MMLDIGKEKVDIECPECKCTLQISLEQVANEDVVNCHRCKQEVKLIDEDHSAKQTIRDMNKSFSEFEKTLKSFGK